MTEIDQLRSALTQAQTGTPEESLERAIGVYKHAASLIAALEAIQKDAKLLITDIIAETGVTDMKTQAGRVYVTSPAMIVSYDRKGLDALAAEDVDLAARLAPYRTVTERAGTLTIR